MSIRYFLIIIISFLTTKPGTSISQSMQFNPFKLEPTFFNDPKIVDQLVFTDIIDNQTFQFKIINEEDRKGLFIKKDGKWFLHGVVYTFYKGKISSKTEYSFGKKNGVKIEFGDNGNVKFYSKYQNDLLHGEWFQNFNDGSRFMEVKYVNNNREGVLKEYNDGPGSTTGKISREIEYKNGRKHGEERGYDSRGKLSRKIYFENGKQQGKPIYFDL